MGVLGRPVHGLLRRPRSPAEQHGRYAPDGIRRAHFLRLADEAYAKAGKHDTKARFGLDEFERRGDLRRIDAVRAAAEPWTTDYFTAQNPGPKWGARLVAVDRLLWVGRDSEAASLLGQLLRDWLQEQPNDAAEKEAHEWTLQEAAYRLGFRGSESLIPLFAEAIAKPGTSTGILDAVAQGCSRLWGGRKDLAYQGVDWVLMQAPWKEHHRLQVYGYFARKLSRFGRTREADRLLETYAVALGNAKPADRHGYAALIAGLRSDTPPALRRAMVEIHFSYILARGKEPYADWVREWTKDVLWSNAPPDQRRVWFVETGLQLFNLSVTAPAAATYTPAHGVADAAWFLEEGGRKDLAEQARSIAAAMAKGDKGVLFQCALNGAESAARDKRWEDAEQKLEAALAGQSPSADVLRATLVLEQAKRGLGKAAEGDACRNRALALVDQVGLPAGERLRYLTDFASQARNDAEKTQLLERAKAAGQSAGLDLMVDKLNQQLAELALGSGNLAGAKQALLARVNQQEAQRDRLAFDPLLRQQWFADNLSSYRKLLSVAAKQEDAMLALGCAERMRSRALSDQMAWRKVDMAVRLPKG
ncbi:MAG: hypothetical protein HY318_12680, partial [Armatimonadetes bacterium]|nr:hypothetical protein [Armatimonadota bacterium]